MVVSSSAQPIASTSALGLRGDRLEARELGVLVAGDRLSVRVFAGRTNLWLAVFLGRAHLADLRLGPDAGELTNVQVRPAPDGTGICECTTSVGPLRAKLALYENAIVRCTTSLLPSQDVRMTDWPRDLYPAAEAGTVYTKQRGLRSGIVFAGADEPVPFTVLYFQNFSSLTDYYRETKRTPADTVGGAWPELGYAPPAGDDCVLRRAREYVVSDAYLSLAADAPQTDDAIAARYLDQLAEIYAVLDKPEVGYHDWAERAERALRDLSLSPLCTYARQGRRYLRPYVADDAKPPESMVQLTLAVNAGEYDAWRNSDSMLARALREGAASFFDAEVGSVVRWLPGEPFADAQAEENMNHAAMDSWYLHHSLFNVFRIARNGDEAARELFRTSLPFLVRVAHRFDYRWPIFFDLRTLDVIRAEAAPGRGGEADVAGLYALVMIHAHEMFGDESYLQEAEQAASRLHGLGFRLAYQLNTTGFAAEAALRLWKITRKRSYLGLSETCLANVFDNMWLWQCDYERARHYRTFFGLFPLCDAPYIAPYEELEAHAKFREFLAAGGDDVRPSLKLLLAEYQKYALDRCWYYYPDVLPVDVVAEKIRNGTIERSLSVPLEDLRDGREPSGQVGQEVYGAGLPFVMTSRHYVRLGATGTLAYCNYPMYDFRPARDGGRWRAGGDPRGSCELRIIPAGAGAQPRAVSVTVRAGAVRVPLTGRLSPQGHAVFRLRGGREVEIRCVPAAAAAATAIVIGPLAAEQEAV